MIISLWRIRSESLCEIRVSRPDDCSQSLRTSKTILLSEHSNPQSTPSAVTIETYDGLLFESLREIR